MLHNIELTWSENFSMSSEAGFTKTWVFTFDFAVPLINCLFDRGFSWGFHIPSLNLTFCLYFRTLPMFSPAPFRFWACSNTPRSAQAWASEVSSGQVVIEGVSITVLHLQFRIILVTYVTSPVIIMFSKGYCWRALGNIVVCFICSLIRINYLARNISALITLTCGF